MKDTLARDLEFLSYDRLYKKGPNWEQYVQEFFDGYKKVFDAGYVLALWEVVAFTEQNKIAKPEWAREALIDFAVQYNPPNDRKGRPRDLLRDIDIVRDVDHWREQRIAFGRRGKSRRFSWDRAFKAVQQEWADCGDHLSIHTIRHAYKKGKKMMDDPDLLDAILHALRPQVLSTNPTKK